MLGTQKGTIILTTTHMSSRGTYSNYQDSSSGLPDISILETKALAVE